MSFWGKAACVIGHRGGQRRPLTLQVVRSVRAARRSNGPRGDPPVTRGGERGPRAAIRRSRAAASAGAAAMPR